MKFFFIPFNLLFMLTNAQVESQVDEEIINTEELLNAINGGHNTLLENIQKTFQHMEFEVNNAQNEMLTDLQATFRQMGVIEKEAIAKRVKLYQCRKNVQKKLDRFYNEKADVIFDIGRNTTKTLSEMHKNAGESLNAKFETMHKFMEELNQCPNNCNGYIVRQSKHSIMTNLTGCAVNKCRENIFAKYEEHLQQKILAEAPALTDETTDDFWKVTTGGVEAIQDLTEEFFAYSNSVYAAYYECAQTKLGY